MQHVLRGIHGSHAGAVYVLEGEQTLLGRAADAHIHLMDEGAAAYHARIERMPDGSFELVDLSTTGTFVGITRVTRHPLRDGDTFRIMGSRYAFEVRRAAVQTSPIFRRPVLAARAQEPAAAANDAVRAWPRPRAEVISDELRRSAQRPTREVPRLVADEPVAAANDDRWTPTLWIQETLIEQGMSLDDASGAYELDAAFWEPIERELTQEGLPVFGQSNSFAILHRVREYRELRVRALHGRPLDAIERRRLELLRRQLKPARPGDNRPITSRKHQRFVCHLSAQLLSRVSDTLVSHPVELLNISAGGAKLEYEGDLLDIGEQSWLAVPLGDDGRAQHRSVVFRSSVVWTRQPQAQLGLLFRGLPRLAPEAPQVAVARS